MYSIILFKRKWPLLALLLAMTTFTPTSLVLAQAGALIKFGNSYVNISKQTTGGPVNTGDELEIRTTLYVSSSYNGGTGRIYFVRYVDSLPINTDTITGRPLRTITNEGLTFRSYTLAAGDDAGTFVKNPLVGFYQIKINLGGVPFSTEPTAPLNTSAADITGAKNLQGNSNKPKANGGTIITTAFRVRVTGATGDTIKTGMGKILFKLSNSGVAADVVYTAAQLKIIIGATPACTGAIGANFVAEYGGTFDSGVNLNRTAGPTFPIPSYSYVNNVSRTVNVGDGTYAIVKNTSPINSTNPNARRQPNCSAAPIPVTDSCANRMFGGFWYIHGDHTGTNNAAGNPPPSATQKSGYMLMVNADVTTSEAYKQTISGLCPDTYYNFSAWIRNICPNCGIDSSGSSTYKPGVLPNLTFVVDGIDYYSTGDIDTVGWVQKGFSLKTDTAQTSFTIAIRNNAPGGGGNDWVMDDISLASCTPNINITPGSGFDSTCFGNSITFTATITSNYNNYNFWKWQKKPYGSSVWSDVQVGNTTPTWNGSAWEYTISLNMTNVPASDSGAQFRAVFAPTFSTLNSAGCNYISNVITLLVRSVYSPTNVCKVLPVKVVDLIARKDNSKVNLYWNTENEEGPVTYQIERSSDGTNFIRIGERNGNGQLQNQYNFTDISPLKGFNYYRLKVIDSRTNRSFYTSIAVVQMEEGKKFDLVHILNPFKDQLYVTLSAVNAGPLKLQLNSLDGRTVASSQQNISKGISQLQMQNLSNLPAGIYLLRIEMGSDAIVEKVYKTQ
jgi:hypothetical protein